MRPPSMRATQGAASVSSPFPQQLNGRHFSIFVQLIVFCVRHNTFGSFVIAVRCQPSYRVQSTVDIANSQQSNIQLLWSRDERKYICILRWKTLVLAPSYISISYKYPTTLRIRHELSTHIKNFHLITACRLQVNANCKSTFFQTYITLRACCVTCVCVCPCPVCSFLFAQFQQTPPWTHLPTIWP